jgi:hypothetical protein
VLDIALYDKRRPVTLNSASLIGSFAVYESLLTPLHFELVEVFLLNHGKFCLDGISAVGNRADLCGRTKDRDGTQRDIDTMKLVASPCRCRMRLDGTVL